MGVGISKAVLDNLHYSIAILVKYYNYVNHINRHLTLKKLIAQSLLIAAI